MTHSKKSWVNHAWLVLLTTFAATQAVAHPWMTKSGSTSLLWQGLIHPITGIDHWASMIGVGMVAAKLGGPHRWRIPGLFVLSMLLGAALGVSGLAGGLGSWAEWFIVISMIFVGAIAAISEVSLTRLMPTLVIFAGSCHGFAHGRETPAAGVMQLWYFFGFSVTTVLLLALGIKLRCWPIRRLNLHSYDRMFGTALVSLGLGLMLARLV